MLFLLLILRVRGAGDEGLVLLVKVCSGNTLYIGESESVYMYMHISNVHAFNDFIWEIPRDAS